MGKIVVIIITSKIVTDMQFILTPNFKQKTISVKFITPISPSFWKSLTSTLYKIGGTYQNNPIEWTFPYHITGQIIQEIIHNTCFMCGGLMKDSTAIKVNVRKCSQCGHSHT